MTGLREYHVRAESTGTFGRVICSARNHHVVVDGPEGNGCPGEELTPVEVFFSAVAACGVELLQVIAREDGVPLRHVRMTMRGGVDRSSPVREDVTLFNRVSLSFELEGVDREAGVALVEKFKGR